MFSVLVVTIIVNMIICYHLIIGGMSISKHILESSFSCGNGGLVTVINIWMWQVFCLHVNTSSATLPSSVNIQPLYLFNAVKILLNQLLHTVSDCLLFFKEFLRRVLIVQLNQM